MLQNGAYFVLQPPITVIREWHENIMKHNFYFVLENFIIVHTVLCTKMNQKI